MQELPFLFIKIGNNKRPWRAHMAQKLTQACAFAQQVTQTDG